MSFNSDLISLIKNNENEKAKSLIKAGKKMYEATDKSRNTLLYYAAEYGNIEIMIFLICSCGCNVDLPNDFGQTTLVKILKSVSNPPSAEVIELLLQNLASVDIEDSTYTTALDIVNSCEWLSADTRRIEIFKVFFKQRNCLDEFPILHRGNKDVIKLLLQANINLTEAHYPQQETVIHRLATNSNPGVLELLHGRDLNVDIRDNNGRTPLMYAAEKGNTIAAEFLLKEGADIEATNVFQTTALYLAVSTTCERGEETLGTIQVLLEHGANVQIEISNASRFRTIFDMLLWTHFDVSSLTEVLLAHVALQEALGTTITELIRRQIYLEREFQLYFENCQLQVLLKICPEVTLIDILKADEKQMERYLRNRELAPKLLDFKTKIEYFDTILLKRISKACKTIELRQMTAQIVCKLMMMCYDAYLFVAEQIADYLEEQDKEYLISIQNEIFDDIADVMEKMNVHS